MRKWIFSLSLAFCFSLSFLRADAPSLQESPYCIFAGSASQELAASIAEHLGISLGKAKVGRFNDGEIDIQIQENVRGKEVFIIQSTCRTSTASVNDNLMELFLMVRALKRSSAHSVTAIIPYYGYARQDRKTSPRVPISASDIAMMLEDAGVDRVVAIDLHCGQIQGFFRDAPVDNLFSTTIFVPYFAKKQLEKPVVLSPDAGGVDRAKEFKDTLASLGVEAGFGVIIKQRAGAGVVAQMDLVGDVEGSDVIIVDDLCDTGGTLVRAAEELKAFGARRIFACITHPVFSKDAVQKIGNSLFTEVVVADTIPHAQENFPPNIKRLSVAPLLAEVIRRLHSALSLHTLFELGLE